MAESYNISVSHWQGEATVVFELIFAVGCGVAIGALITRRDYHKRAMTEREEAWQKYFDG